MAAGASCLVPLALLMVRVISENTPSVSDQNVSPRRNLTGVKNDSPKFGEPIANMTVPVGREAVLTCLVEDLGAYKVAWLRVDTQTILTIHGHVITKNHRIGVTHSDHRNWYLHIKDVRQSDRGWYMCQINTDPMKSQVGFLDVVVPPDILDFGTSTDRVVREGSNVTFNCAASGSPAPNITWRREGGDPIPGPAGQEVTSVEGPKLNLTKISRTHIGAYLCIASNGVPPSVSKRIMLLVHFPPMIWIQNQLVGAMVGEDMTLECHSEAYPKSINYWTRESGELISQGPKFEAANVDNSYKVLMKLTIRSVSVTDYGSYKCVSKNSLGDTDGTIKLYHIPTPTTTIATTVTTEEITTTTKVIPKIKQEKKKQKERKKQQQQQQQQQQQVVHQVNDIAQTPETRDEIPVSSSDRVKVEENRSETKMDRSHFPASGASSQLGQLSTRNFLSRRLPWISVALSALSFLSSNFGADTDYQRFL